MANSTNDYPTISASQASKEVTANALHLGASPALLWGIDAPNTSALTLGLLEGVLNVAGTPTFIAATTVALSASATNYVEATTAGVVSKNTSAFTAGRLRLYTVITGASTITSYQDWRHGGTSAGVTGTAGSGDVVGPASAVNNKVAFFDGTTGKLIKDSGLSLSGTNTGDQTTVSGNAGTATALQTARTIGGVSFDGTANITQPVVVGLFYPGVPTASVLIGSFAAPAGITTLTAAAAIAGSSGKALVAATAQTDIDVRKNATTSAGGSSVGTIRFAASGTVPTFIAASGFTLTGGTDYITCWGPSSPDASLANIAVSLYFTR